MTGKGRGQVSGIRSQKKRATEDTERPVYSEVGTENLRSAADEGVGVPRLGLKASLGMTGKGRWQVSGIRCQGAVFKTNTARASHPSRMFVAETLLVVSCSRKRSFVPSCS
jgi:hypothetical protein